MSVMASSSTEMSKSAIRLISLMITALVELKPLGSHIARQVVENGVGGLLVFQARERADDIFDIFAIVFHCDTSRGILHFVWWGHNGCRSGLGVGRIYIQLKIRHNEEVVPEFAFKIGHLRGGLLDVCHNSNERFCSEISLLAVFDGGELYDHILNVSAILGQVELFALNIVICFHLFEKLIVVENLVVLSRIKEPFGVW